MSDEYNENEDEELAGISDEVLAKIRAQGAANFAKTIRDNIGEEKSKALQADIKASIANPDPLTSTPRENWTYEQHSEAYGRGLEDLADMPEEVQEKMERGMRR